MDSDARNTAAAINAAISSADHRYSAPEQRRWKGYWTRYWCFKSQKREKRIVPAARSEGVSGSARGWPPAQAGLALAPPSSPASFVNSSVQSPASFTLSLSAASASMCSPGPPNTMFMIGPYAHETQLVSPPVFSTFTTEPSTAPFTPPPELAHLTTPSSPDVPFAQYIASSLEAKTTARGTISPLSTSTLASPCETPASYTPTSSHLYLGSPVGRLISPTLGYSGREVVSGEKISALSSVSLGRTVSSFPTFHPFASPTFDGVPFAALTLPCDSNSKSEDPPPSVVLHCDSNHKHEDSSMLNEAGVIILESEVELDLRHGHGGITGSMPSEQCDTYHLNTDGAALQSDGAYPASSANEDEHCTDRVERVQEFSSYEPDKSDDSIFFADAKQGYFDVSTKDSYHFNITNSAAKMKGAGTEKLGQSPAAAVDLWQEQDMKPKTFESDKLS